MRTAEEVREIVERVAAVPEPARRRIEMIGLQGETEVLVALARREPDRECAQVAWFLIVMAATRGQTPWSDVVAAMPEMPAAIRAAILRRVHAESPFELRAVVLPSLDDDDREVRLAAFEALVRLRETTIGIDGQLRAWLDRAEPSDREAALGRWIDRGDQPTIVRALIGASRAVCRDAVVRFRARSWEDVAPLLDRDPELIVHCTFAFADVPLAWLVRMTHAYALLEAARRIDLGDSIDESPADDRAAFAARCEKWLDAHPESELHAMVERARQRAAS